MLIQLDFEKAFDKVEYSSLFSAFEYFGITGFTLDWIKIFFNDMELSTISNGYTSKFFTPSRGLFQGNPIGLFAFNVLIEILAINLRKNENIQGIQVRDIIYLISQFADDMTLFMQFNQRSWEAVISELTNFENGSGLTINYDKTTVYRLGSIRNSNAKFYSRRRISWTNEPVNILGIFVSNSSQEMLELNYNEILEKARNIFRQWSYRGLSLYGKIMVANSLVTSL